MKTTGSSRTVEVRREGDEDRLVANVSLASAPTQPHPVSREIEH